MTIIDVSYLQYVQYMAIVARYCTNPNYDDHVCEIDMHCMHHRHGGAIKDVPEFILLLLHSIVVVINIM